MNKNVAVTSFYGLVSKIGKKIAFYVVLRKEKTLGLCCFLNAKS